MTGQHLLKQQINRGVEALKKGGLVAYPTDTVYGLGADPLNERAVFRIYELKNRSRDVPLPLLLADRSDLPKVASIVSEVAWQLAYKFWPGGLTLVVKKTAWVPDTVTSGGETIAVRVPDHPVPIALIKGLGNPIIGTSANLSGKTPAVTAEGVSKQLANKVDLIIDGGRCPGGIESTVVDVSGALPTMIREGAIPVTEIEKVCKSLLPRITLKNRGR